MFPLRAKQRARRGQSIAGWGDPRSHKAKTAARKRTERRKNQAWGIFMAMLFPWFFPFSPVYSSSIVCCRHCRCLAISSQRRHWSGKMPIPDNYCKWPWSTVLGCLTAAACKPWFILSSSDNRVFFSFPCHHHHLRSRPVNNKPGGVCECVCASAQGSRFTTRPLPHRGSIDDSFQLPSAGPERRKVYRPRRKRKP